ncbi:MAG TPA: DUF6064 family protein [Thermoanaerobaculia bacterium]|jgi:hypothetical protein
MSEWWTYHLSDFLLFSARTYYRLFEIYNAAIWPAQILALALGIGILVLLRRGPATSKWISWTLAAGWIWTAVAFLKLRYATINWSAAYFAWAFGIEGLALLLIGGSALTFERPRDLAGRIGLATYAFALLVLPFAAALPGREWRGAQLFLLCPDPTAIGTFGLLLCARARHRWLLMIVPVLWCLYSGFFLLAMKSPDWWIAPLLAGLAVVFSSVSPVTSKTR